MSDFKRSLRSMFPCKAFEVLRSVSSMYTRLLRLLLAILGFVYARLSSVCDIRGLEPSYLSKFSYKSERKEVLLRNPFIFRVESHLALLALLEDSIFTHTFSSARH